MNTLLFSNIFFFHVIDVEAALSSILWPWVFTRTKRKTRRSAETSHVTIFWKSHVPPPLFTNIYYWSTHTWVVYFFSLQITDQSNVLKMACALWRCNVQGWRKKKPLLGSPEKLSFWAGSITLPNASKKLLQLSQSHGALLVLGRGVSSNFPSLIDLMYLKLCRLILYSLNLPPSAGTLQLRFFTDICATFNRSGYVV